ncbi:ABC transporter ATP-binding protein [Falsirhodobacter sp. 20TX0035]|uniref:ABC transporter ATP-binding protein n=1 Tax=Falsirhodobacter sp. 20TX0035 TaxID=3022019 RepID=UPI002330BAED|nr:ABC transporter ATP-binding protein [Falsirhodobacter sp. 20TX0035]MDB6454798.1 ABC transporter ATP-binding protein [Falsirhodobacter sp. 20TX0035]
MTGSRTELSSFFTALARMERRRLTIGTTLLVLGTLTEGISILLFLPILQLVGNGENVVDLARLNLPAFVPDAIPLWVLLVFIVLLTAAQAAFNRSKGIYLTELVHDFTDRFRLSLFRDIAAARWDSLVRLPRSRIEHALTGEIERLYMATFNLLTILQGAIGLGLYLVLSLLVSVPMTLLSFGFGLVALSLMRPFRKAAGRHGTRLQEKRKRQSHAVSEFVGGLKVARSMNLERRYQGVFSDILHQTRIDAVQYVRQSSVGSGLFQVSAVAGAALFIWVARSGLGMDLARIAVLLILFMRAGPRFLGLQASVQQLLVDLPAWRDIRTLQDQLDEWRDPAADGTLPAPAPQHEICLDRVTWRFPGATRNVLTDLTLRIPANRISVITGPSGAGKSTIADLVIGLLQADQGRLLVDGQPLEAGQLRAWRDRTAYVTQDPHLIDGTIRANLMLAVAEPGPGDEGAMQLALSRASANFVAALPDGIDSPVGERGGLLSGGERQRIALARALMRDPDILILDEATSALDWENELALAETIGKLKGSVTVLVITHRPALLAVADVVHVMDDGRIVQSEQPGDGPGQPDGYLSGLRTQGA